MADLFTKRNIIIALSLGIVVLAVVPGIKLIQEQQQIKSRAEDLDKCPFENSQCAPESNPVVCGSEQAGCFRYTCQEQERAGCNPDEEDCIVHKWSKESSECPTPERRPRSCEASGNLDYDCEEGVLKASWNIQPDDNGGFQVSIVKPDDNEVTISESQVQSELTAISKDKIGDLENNTYKLVLRNGGSNESCAGDRRKVIEKQISCATPTGKEIESIKIKGQDLDLEGNTPLTITLPGSTTTTITIEIKYTDGSLKEASITFRYNQTPQACQFTAQCPGAQGCIDGICKDVGGTKPPTSTSPTASTQPASCSQLTSSTDRVINESCSKCIERTIPGMTQTIRGNNPIGWASCSQKDLLQFWCNGGVSDAAVTRCNSIYNGVCARDCGGTASPSPTPTPTPSAPPTTPPGQPALSASCPTGSTTPTLTWTAVPGAVSYDIRVDNHKGTASFTRKDCGPHSVCVNSYTSTSLTFQGSSDGDYRAWVQAIGQNRTGGGVSNTAAFQCVPRVPPPTPPSSPSPSPSPSPISLTCDFNNDGKYDASDFKIWSDEFTGQKTTKKANCSGDEIVDLVDFNLWRDQKIERE